MANPSPASDDVEKGTWEGGSVADASGEVQDKPSKSPQAVTQPGFLGKLEMYMKKFEHQLVKYNVEARGLQRVEPQEDTSQDMDGLPPSISPLDFHQPCGSQYYPGDARTNSVCFELQGRSSLRCLWVITR